MSCIQQSIYRLQFVHGIEGKGKTATQNEKKH